MARKRSWHAATVVAAPPTMIDSSPEVARVAPRVFQTSALPRSMSCTTSEKPCLTRFSAIGPPMLPSPMNPTVLDIAVTPPSWGQVSQSDISSRQGSCPAAESRAPIPLTRAPRERSEVTVVLARGVVPVDPERVHVAPGGFREGQATGGRMTDIVEVNRLGLLGTGNSLDGDVERPRDRYGPAHPGGLDADRLGFDSGEVAHQWRQGSHRPAALSAS